MPGTLHVFVHAPTDFRATHVARERGMPLAKARSEVEASDRERVRFFQTTYHVNWYDLRLYDLVVDTSILSVHGAAGMIADMAMHACAALSEPATLEGARAAADARAMRPRSGNGQAAGGLDGLNIRPMTPADAGGLLALFRSLPPADGGVSSGAPSPRSDSSPGPV